MGLFGLLNEIRKAFTLTPDGKTYYDDDGNMIDWSEPGAGYHKELRDAYWAEVRELAESRSLPELVELHGEEGEALLDQEESPYGLARIRDRIEKIEEAIKLK